MYGSNYYGSVEYGGTKLDFTQKVKKAISNIILNTKNRVAQLLTVNNKGVLNTKNDNIIL